LIELIRERLSSYNAANPLEEEYAVKEILQDIALYGLWRAGFCHFFGKILPGNKQYNWRSMLIPRKTLILHIAILIFLWISRCVIKT